MSFSVTNKEVEVKTTTENFGIFTISEECYRRQSYQRYQWRLLLFSVQINSDHYDICTLIIRWFITIPSVDGRSIKNCFLPAKILTRNKDRIVYVIISHFRRLQKPLKDHIRRVNVSSFVSGFFQFNERTILYHDCLFSLDLGTGTDPDSGSGYKKSKWKEKD